MQTDRRLLLKGLAAAGLAVSGMGWAQAAVTAHPDAAAASHVLALTSAGAGSALEQAFVAGVRSAGPAVAHTALQGLDSATFHDLGQRLADGQDTLLVGLLDDASATLVLDLLRSAGGRVLEEQHHRVDAGATNWAHHLGHALAGGPALAQAPSPAGAEARVSFRCMI